MTSPWLQFYDEGVPRSVQIPDKSIVAAFDEAVEQAPDDSIISYFGRDLSYAEVARDVEQCMLALTRLGVGPGDRVAIMLPNIPQYVVFHFAILKIGAIIVPVNPLYVERELSHQLRDSGAGTVIVLDFMFPKTAAVRAEAGLENIIVTRVSHYLPRLLKLFYPLKAYLEGRHAPVARQKGVHFYEDLLAESFPIALPVVKVEPQDTAMLLYTGGTTGVAKGAVLSHKNLFANTFQLRAWCPDIQDRQEVLLSALPFFHSYGLTTCLHMAVLTQSKMILLPNPRDIKAILSSIAKQQATLFPGVPTLFVAVNNFPKVRDFDLSSVRVCVSGGAPLPAEVSHQFEGLSGGKLVEGYGLSEASPVTHANPITGKRKTGAIGLPLPGTEARVVAPDTKQEVKTGEIGELAVRGPQVMSGYWRMPEESSQVLSNGWLFTGDLARVDEEGYFYIVDRQKDMIIAGGYNIYPREIEDILYEHPQIMEAAVIGVTDKYRGETVKAFVVPVDDTSPTVDDIMAFCSSRLAPFKVPKQIEFRESLPKSSIGKILRRVLKEESE